VFGYAMKDKNNYPNSLYTNISVLGRISGNSHVCGMGAFAMYTKSDVLASNVFVEVLIESQEGIAYGIGSNVSDIACLQRRTNCGGQCWFNCQCNCLNNVECWNGNISNCNCQNQCSDGDCNGKNFSASFKNCATKIHKNPNVGTYYAISNISQNTYVNCYTDDSEFAPIISSGIEYKNLSNIKYSIDLLPYLDKTIYKKELNSKVEPLNLNKDSIYFKTVKGYIVYNFETQEWELKYTNFNNQNSIKIIQNGMNRNDLAKIPSVKLKELQDKNSKIKIVNCINAHEKIVSKTEVVEVNKYQEYVDKNIFKNKIKFNKYNDKIMSIIKQ
jgi:hypothetical protein